MFYSQDILQKRGGKFFKIWMAVFKPKKLTKRDWANINVAKTCDDILAYIELRIAPATAGGRRPRLSLYLSANLMYGAIRVHQKHIDALYADVSSVFLRIGALQHVIMKDIDLQDLPRADLVTNPDLMTEEMLFGEDLLEFEGLMLPSPPGPVPKRVFWGINGYTSHSGSEPNGASPAKRRRAKKPREEVGSPQVASIDQITMKEHVPLRMDTPLSPILVPKDVELPTLDGQDIDILMGQSHLEEIHLSVHDLLPTSTPFMEDTDQTTRQRLRSRQTAAMESPSRIIQEEKEKTPGRMPPPTEVPEPRVVPPSPGVTQPIITSPLPRRTGPRESLELELTRTVAVPERRKGKRQLAFADAETQIPKEKMKQNMMMGKDTCEPFRLVDVKGSAATDLLSVPGTHELRRKPWLNLWTRNARLRRNLPAEELAEAISPIPEYPSAVPDQHFTFEGQDLSKISEEGIQRALGEEIPPIPPQLAASPVLPVQEEHRPVQGLEETIEELRRISKSMGVPGTPVQEMSSIEVQRDISTSRIDDKQASFDENLTLDVSGQSRKDKSSARKRRTRSSAGEQQATPTEAPPRRQDSTFQSSHTSGRTLYDVAEEPRFEEMYVAVPLLQAVAEEEMEDFLRVIKEDVQHQSGGYTTFRKICPPQHVDRKTAAKNFMVLLEQCAIGTVNATQQKSYGEIYITLGGDQ